METTTTELHEALDIELQKMKVRKTKERILAKIDSDGWGFLSVKDITDIARIINPKILISLKGSKGRLTLCIDANQLIDSMKRWDDDSEFRVNTYLEGDYSGAMYIAIYPFDNPY